MTTLVDLFIRSVIVELAHNDLKYPMTLNTTFSLLLISEQKISSIVQSSVPRLGSLWGFKFLGPKL